MFSKINKITIKLHIFVIFVSLLPSLVTYRSHMTLFSSMKNASVQNLTFLKKKFVINLLASTRVFSKTCKLLFIFLSVFDVLLLDVRHIVNNYLSQWLPVDEQKNQFNYFVFFVANDIHDFKTNCFRKKNKTKLLLNFV